MFHNLGINLSHISHATLLEDLVAELCSCCRQMVMLKLLVGSFRDNIISASSKKYISGSKFR